MKKTIIGNASLLGRILIDGPMTLDDVAAAVDPSTAVRMTSRPSAPPTKDLTDKIALGRRSTAYQLLHHAVRRRYVVKDGVFYCLTNIGVARLATLDPSVFGGEVASRVSGVGGKIVDQLVKRLANHVKNANKKYGLLLALEVVMQTVIDENCFPEIVRVCTPEAASKPKANSTAKE